jgi:hypothetical protein
MGTKAKDGKTWTGRFFDNQDELVQQLASFGVGDKCNVRMVKNVAKNGQEFWNVGALEQPSSEDLAAEKFKAPAKSKGGGGGNGDKMTKEEWAEKNRIDSIRIAKSVAAKLVAAYCANKDISTENMIEEARKWVPWLLDTELPTPPLRELMDAGDPLEPPAF